MTEEIIAIPKFPKALFLAICEHVCGLTTLSGGVAHAATKEEREAEKEMFVALMVSSNACSS
jgi:hypothetical protein